MQLTYVWTRVKKNFICEKNTKAYICCVISHYVIAQIISEQKYLIRPDDHAKRIRPTLDLLDQTARVRFLLSAIEMSGVGSRRCVVYGLLCDSLHR
jgi:hypothetical protein